MATTNDKETKETAMSPEEVKALQKRLAAAEKRAEEAAAANDELRNAATEAQEQAKVLADQIQASAASGTVPAKPVIGKIEVEWEDPRKGSQKRTIAFKDGHTRVRMGQNIVGSAELIKIAQGKALTKAQLGQFPEMEEITQEEALEHLAKLVAIQYGGLKPIKKAKKK